MLEDSSDLKSENGDESGSRGLQVSNEIIFNDEKYLCLRSHICIQYMWYRFPHIAILYFECIKQTSVELGWV